MNHYHITCKSETFPLGPMKTGNAIWARSPREALIKRFKLNHHARIRYKGDVAVWNPRQGVVYIATPRRLTPDGMVGILELVYVEWQIESLLREINWLQCHQLEIMNDREGYKALLNEAKELMEWMDKRTNRDWAKMARKHLVDLPWLQTI